MISRPNPIYRLLHTDYAESFARYSSQTTDFYDPIVSQLPETWSVQRREMWFYCSPSRHMLPLQGWKIHVSATLGNACEVLERVASVLFKYRDVSFKFALDRPLLSLLNSKGWPRGASGKFITIYPASSNRFLDLVEEVAEATAGLVGPYVLSDHRYKSSRVVFYRYGGMKAHTALNVKGEKVPVLISPDGAIVHDQRLAYPVVPEWEAPVLPLEDSQTRKGGSLDLHDSRYKIEAAMAFSSAGGVYLGRDNQTGKKVVIKEARPCINATNDNYDAVELLKKEYRLLGVLANTGIAPQPIDLFQEWEHWFLVEEFIEGTTMSHHSAANNVLLRNRANRRDQEAWCTMFSILCEELLRILGVLHRHNIIFADLSTNNLIVVDRHKLKIIDFEGAYQVGVDRAVNIFTPGFASQQRIAGGEATRQDDHYAAGAVLLSYLLPITGLLHLNPQAKQEFLDSIREHIGLPTRIIDLINTLMGAPVRALAAPGENSDEPGMSQIEGKASSGQQPSHDYRTVLEDIVRQLNGVADYSRKDRLYPADPRGFSTNPLSLAYGATGVAYALHKITGRVPEAAVDWILQRRIESTEYAPGLYIGMAGIAWSLLEIGITTPAEKIFQASVRHPLLRQSADLFYGMAGWGMTGLRFFQETGKEIYLDYAIETGNSLLASCQKSEHGYYWANFNEHPMGLAHGSSGIALFFLYLYLATKNDRYLAAGIQALDFDLASAIHTKDGGLSWSTSAEAGSVVYPYWRFGSAGIGTVTARFQRLIPSQRYQSVLEQIYVHTDTQYAVTPGRFCGLAGLGEFLLDMHELSGERRFLESANKVARGIMHFRVERNGLAFPGELLSRLSCDYGTGSSGIALFFNRLIGQQKSDFMLDELFSAQQQDIRNTAEKPPISPSHAASRSAGVLSDSGPSSYYIPSVAHRASHLSPRLT